MNVWLYRRRLSLRSGAGQLVQMQAEGLERAGIRPLLAAERRRIKYFLRTGRYISSLSIDMARAAARNDGTVFVDHSCRVPEAGIVFVHNLASAAAAHVPSLETGAAIAEEASFFAALRPDALVVANSRQVRDAIVGSHGLSPDRVEVLYPGYRAARFDSAVRRRQRKRARRALGIAGDDPLVGFVSSGNLEKRGIRILLETAERIHAERPDARFLVVGSTELPEALRGHALHRAGRLRHQPRSSSPERWYAALDLFLYPAAWEEFGIVVLEAQAMGLAVLTSRRVGAAECLPGEYAPWLGDVPEAGRLAADALRLIEDGGQRAELVAAGLRAVRDLDDRRYADQAAALILRQKR